MYSGMGQASPDEIALKQQYYDPTGNWSSELWGIGLTVSQIINLILHTYTATGQQISHWLDTGIVIESQLTSDQIASANAYIATYGRTPMYGVTPGYVPPDYGVPSPIIVNAIPSPVVPNPGPVNPAPMIVPMIVLPSATAYFNSKGDAYTNEAIAYWWNDDEGQWYSGDKTTGQIIALGYKAPWLVPTPTPTLVIPPLPRNLRLGEHPRAHMFRPNRSCRGQ